MKKVVALGRRGFTLIEVIVVAAIIAILAGILVPMIFNQIDESKKTRASGDCKTIVSAITAFRGSPGIGGAPITKYPIYYTAADCTATASLLYSDGLQISNEWAAGLSDQLIASVLNNVPANHACYNNTAPINVLASVTGDPWGNRYIINSADLLTPGAPVWVISAGPNGILDTDSNSPTINNRAATLPTGSPVADDIGIRVQ